MVVVCDVSTHVDLLACRQISIEASLRCDGLLTVLQEELRPLSTGRSVLHSLSAIAHLALDRIDPAPVVDRDGGYSPGDAGLLGIIEPFALYHFDVTNRCSKTELLSKTGDEEENEQNGVIR